MHYISLLRGLPFLVLPICLNAQYQALASQTDTFNSSIVITAAQRESAGINATLANNVAIALNFERSNFAHGPAASDEFYTVPSNATAAAPGTLLKLDLDANTSAYTLPPNTAISRILFQTESINGSAVPASAYILWPYLPRTQPDGFPVVAWAHGTSGLFANCAPSQYRNLLYQFATVYELALQGYVVVAPDYAGLGVAKDVQGRPLVHPYLGNPSHANDLIYAVQAAREAFPSLSRRFVVMGHSQGGGAAWSAAVRQASRPVEGYLGAVVGSPVTDFLGLANPALAMFIAYALVDRYPGFRLEDVLTAAGIARFRLYEDVQGCFSVASVLLADADLVRANWTSDADVRAWNTLSNAAGKAIAGPVLVLQGDADPAIPVALTTRAVQETCARHPESKLEYEVFAGATHVPVMFASQRVWLDWIAARFAGAEVPGGCRRRNRTSARPYGVYQKEQDWFVEFATMGYQTA